MQQGPDQQQVRPGDPGGEPGGAGARPRRGAGRRSRRARGRAAAGRAPRPTPGTAAPTGRCGRATPRRRRAAPGAQQRQQLVQRRPRPGFAQLGRGVGEAVQRARRHRQPGARRRRGDAAAPAPGRGRPRRRGPARPPRVLDDARCRAGGAPAGGAARRGPGGAARSAPSAARPRRRTRRRARPRTAPGPGRSGRRSPARRHLVGVLGAQHVAGAPGEAVQLRADVEQQVTASSTSRAGRSTQLGRGERVDQLDVAQPAVAVLQVGLDAVGDRPRPCVQRSWAAVGELVEPAADPRPPGLPDRAADGVGQPGVAGDVPGLQQPERGAQVGRRDLDGLPGGAHGVVEPDPGVPQRVPQLARRAARRPCGRRAAARGRGPSTARARAGPARRPRPARRGPRGRSRRACEESQKSCRSTSAARSAAGREPAPPGRLGQQHRPGPHEVLADEIRR